MLKIKKKINIRINKINFLINTITKEISKYNERKTRNISVLKINHAGEISAQYLYYGQSLLIYEKFTKYFLLKSGKEEKKHLFWCIKYLEIYQSKKSFLYNIWKYGSFSIGLIPSFFNYKYNLGFLIETELQVLDHLNQQISSLSYSEYSLFFILNKMSKDEVKHANNAILLRSKDIPYFLKNVMGMTSFLMLNSSPYI